jgi:hypothetical protein
VSLPGTLEAALPAGPTDWPTPLDCCCEFPTFKPLMREGLGNRASNRSGVPGITTGSGAMASDIVIV